jgi:glycine/D-amino acid oxidase-like deaminating enzyme
VSVVLCEKGGIAAEQSSRNWGWCRKMGRDPRELPLIIESLALWGDMNELVAGETGFRRTGTLYLCRTEAELARRAAWLEHARLYQLDSRVIGAAEIERVAPGSTERWAGAVLTASDGRAEPQKAAPAIAAAARRLGAVVLTGCAVRGIETAAGRVAAAVTERGRIACDAVVLAGGAWSRLFCGSLGLTLPQLHVLASVMRTEPLPGGPDLAASAPGFAFRRRLDGGYTVANNTVHVADIVPDSFRFFFDFLPVLRIERKALRLRVGRRFLDQLLTPRRWALDRPSPFEKVRVLDPAPTGWALDAAEAALAQCFPVFRRARRAESWAGLIDATPDTVPVISAVDRLPGFVIASGFSGHGFGIGPAAGRLAADLVTGDPPLVDPTPFRFSRFSDGTRPQPVTGV